MIGARDDDAVEVSVGGKSGRSVGLSFLVDPTPELDELAGVEEVIEARPFGQLVGAGFAIVIGGAGVVCLVAPLLGEDLLWLVAGGLLLTWGVVFFRKALRIRPGRVLVYGDRLAFYFAGKKREYFWSDVSHVEHVTYRSRNSAHTELRLHLQVPAEGEDSVRLADDRQYDALERITEALQKHCDVRFRA